MKLGTYRTGLVTDVALVTGVTDTEARLLVTLSMDTVTGLVTAYPIMVWQMSASKINIHTPNTQSTRGQLGLNCLPFARCKYVISDQS